MLPVKKATCEPVRKAEDIFSIEEVKRISTRFLEQAVLVLYDENDNIQVLCGPCCSKTCAVAPSICSIIHMISVYKILFKEAMVVHNHPTLPWHGEVIPSEDDVASTELLKWQLALLGVKLLDHVVITGHKKRSLSEMDLCVNRGLHINGLEIKRFLYCFLTQIAAVLEYDDTINVLNDLLAKNLAFLSDYYNKHYLARLFLLKPVDAGFTARLDELRSGDILLDYLINILSNLEDGKKIRLHPEGVIPYGEEFQKRIISGEYKISCCR
ncbi:JAB domain-containing protein [Desulfoscipio gibsoniae]|uniref:DNA repair protein n=1 Tax=Desulfoscipio gibsoniae DSM 7213 TaxID=767817 RepID=R4KP59_9FIRM|nr:JAB domain-containing protein [Desulfoscipio gibsoniae]AGL03347.1 DNA repair protein [Desulfoscipio gibsoniae DSM 7213]